MEYKRLTIVCGHYGSGKTNIAVNMAFDLRKKTERVTVADLDIVNPYFRSADSQADLEKAGIRLIASDYVNTNLDVPALPQAMYALCDDKKSHAVIDLGGDDRGALALGRIRDRIAEENDFEAWFVLNAYRPLTRTSAEALEVMREVSAASGLPLTGLIHNSNLGAETTAQTVMDSLGFAEEVSRLSGLPLVATTVCERLCPALAGKVPNLFPLILQNNVIGDTIV